jgi:UrcA family protein
MRRKFLAVAIPFAACMAWGNTLAQPLEEIVVEGSPIVKEKQGKTDPGTPAPLYYNVVMSSRVSYADLDLAKPADVATLESRIKEAANFVCDKLGKAYPDSEPDTMECAKRAADKALAEAKKVAAAGK